MLETAFNTKVRVNLLLSSQTASSRSRFRTLHDAFMPTLAFLVIHDVHSSIAQENVQLLDLCLNLLRKPQSRLIVVEIEFESFDGGVGVGFLDLRVGPER